MTLQWRVSTDFKNVYRFCSVSFELYKKKKDKRPPKTHTNYTFDFQSLKQPQFAEVIKRHLQTTGLFSVSITVVFYSHIQIAHKSTGKWLQ